VGQFGQESVLRVDFPVAARFDRTRDDLEP
jgi:hypothetical protein